jgi:hypothetical protein
MIKFVDTRLEAFLCPDQSYVYKKWTAEGSLKFQDRRRSWRMMFSEYRLQVLKLKTD